MNEAMSGLHWGESRVVRVERCRLVVRSGEWPFAVRHGAAIDHHWAVRSAENPGFFNGTIFLLARHTLGPGPHDRDAIDGVLTPVAFKSFLYWKDRGYPDPSLRDAFGSALIRSAEGHVVLGRQRAGNINSGLAYLPGGFIDARDVDADGQVDVAASIARELAEETGLGAGDVEPLPGFSLTFAGPMLSIAVEYRSRLTTEALAASIRRHLARDPASELEDVVIVRSARDLDGLAMPLYAHVLLHALFGSA